MTVNVRCYGFPTSNLSYFPSGSLSVDVLRMFYAIFCSYPSHAIVAATPTSCMAFGALWKMWRLALPALWLSDPRGIDPNRSTRW